MTINDRVKQIRLDNSQTQQEFAAALDITQGSLSLIESGKSMLSLDVLIQIRDKYNVSYDWLIDGLSSLKDTDSLIPLVDKAAMAGYPTNHGKEDYERALSVYRIPGFDKGEYRIFEIEGESMLPTFLPHDYVVATKIKDILKIVDGTLGIIITNDEVLAKRIYIINKNTIRLKSDNPSYHDIDYDKKEIQQIWGVQAKITQSFNPPSAFDIRLNQLTDELTLLKEEIRKLKK